MSDEFDRLIDRISNEFAENTINDIDHGYKQNPVFQQDECYAEFRENAVKQLAECAKKNIQHLIESRNILIGNYDANS